MGRKMPCQSFSSPEPSRSKNSTADQKIVGPGYEDAGEQASSLEGDMGTGDFSGGGYSVSW